jgi:O-6-methylguanine DNA methyltransferase
MQYFSETTFLGKYRLLVGMEGDEMIFAHCFRDKKEMEELVDCEREYFPHLAKNDSALKPIFRDLENFGKDKNIDPVKYKVKFSRGTHFERTVWKTLRNTGKGSIITYKQLAENAGYPNAQQAVGQAMSKNYLLLFVPCHRVIANQGQLGGFSAGIELKQALLKLEKVNIERQGRIL